MGLDMYLSRKHYVKNWDPSNPTFEVTILKNGKPLGIDSSKITSVEEEVAYWRKANQIHAWFVENVQNGVDECQESYVSREQLRALVKACKEVVASPELASHTLPTKGGFFFGSTEYDGWYMEDCQNTIDMLESSLNDGLDGEYYYQASW